MGADSDLFSRRHGTRAVRVVVLHGGPADAGGAEPIARGLAPSFGVLEPWQRGSGDQRLSVARHVEDLRQLIEREFARPPALVGTSWGAMLALAFAAAHPASAGPIVLVGCGTFTPAARAEFERLRAERTTPEMKRKLDQLALDSPDPGDQVLRRHELTGGIENFAPISPLPVDPDAPPFDLRAHEETWSDMLRLQREGVYPAAFSQIRAPVLMLHGDYDPHPGPMIRASLLPHLPQLEYHELARCGHSPWLERHAREEFFSVLTRWLHGQGVD